MYPILFDADSLAWDSFGKGILSSAISCEIEEERNGTYELAMEYPIAGALYSEIALRSIIVAKPNYTDNPQPFRVYAISRPINGVVTINAQHISYDTSGYIMPAFTAVSSAEAFTKLKNVSYPSGCPFTFGSRTLSSSKGIAIKHPESLRAVLGGVEGSMLDTYGGEWYFDRLNCWLEVARGANRGVEIRYGRNLMDLRQEENNAAVYTGIYPYYYSPETDELVTLTEQVINAEGTFGFTRILSLDLTAEFQDVPTEEELRTKAQSYIDTHSIGKPDINITIKFLQLTEAQERIDLCDTVTVVFEKLGVSATAKCIRTRWDVLAGRYIEAELGSARTSLIDAIVDAAGIEDKVKSGISQYSGELSDAIDALSDDTEAQLQAIQETINKVTGNVGGYVVMHDTNNDGEPDEILIMDQPDIEDAVNLIRLNNAGIAFSQAGYYGTYTTAWNINGELSANTIMTGELATNLVKIRGDTRFFWDASNINIINPSNPNQIIRLGKYDGTNYGLAFSIDGGLTWRSGFDFNGLQIVSSDPAGWSVVVSSNCMRFYEARTRDKGYIGQADVCNANDETVTGYLYRIGSRARSATIPGENSIALGTDNDPVKADAIAIGNTNYIYGKGTIAIGQNNTSGAEYGIIIGKGTTCANTGIAIGSGPIAAAAAIAIGDRAKANGATSVAIGQLSQADGEKSIAIFGTAGSVGNGIAIGNGSTTGKGIAIGVSAAALHGIAIGKNATVLGEAETPIAIGACSSRGIAIGNSTQTSDETSLAIGNNCSAGYHGLSSSRNAIVVGFSSSALYDRSIIVGWNCEAKQNSGILIGDYLRHDATLIALGKYNSTTTPCYFAIGNGTADDARSDIFEIRTNGDAWVAGTLIQSSDKRLKDVGGELPDLSGIRAVKYRWKKKKAGADEHEHIGYLAQDVEEVAPYLVQEDCSGYKTLDYIGLLCAKVEMLEKTVANLTARIAELEGKA